MLRIVVTVAGAGAFGSAEDALAEWQHAVGPAAGTSLSPSTPETTARLLAPCLDTGPLWDILQGSEPRELIREYYRLRRRDRSLTGATAASAAAASSGGDDPGPVREAFLDWYAARHDDVPQDAADAVDTILEEWGPFAHPTRERSRYACSPHRIETTAHLIREGYFPDTANAALRLLPEWTQWCIGQSGLTADFAARARAAALTEAAALLDEETPDLVVEQNAAPSAAKVKERLRRAPGRCLPPSDPVAGLSWGGVFLSYRREDAKAYARLLEVALREGIPGAHVFLDLDAIEPGLDFAEVIWKAIDSCAVLVALIGPQWATLTDEKGRRRHDSPGDYVRSEIQAALERGMRVIPVLVDGARPPPAGATACRAARTRSDQCF